MSPKIICLTPVKNEAWILDRFLKCASLWADYIIIADQGSTDGSIEIAKQYEKVILVDNKTEGDFNEYSMRKPLFDEARKIEGSKILISLDADEILTPNINSQEWDTIRNSKPGTIISLQRYELLPDDKYWDSVEVWCGYVDDGAPYTSGTIHVPRTIMPSGHDVLICRNIKMLHYKFMDRRRMQDRNHWYQCFELINKINDPITIFRRYHHLDPNRIYDVPNWWHTEYEKYGIEITSILHRDESRWNNQVLSYMEKYGVKFFRHLNIWNVNWCEIAASLQFEDCERFKDPRNKLEKAINRWLIRTQNKQQKTSVHLTELMLRKIYK